ncbi:diguanylate cyclase [Paractinoplanes rhizophilus]|uniref:Diguanylate cyclase n=1 Tax=Paractinoplanes rhizophilus TaxID=1416877 RepID=A0ABW2I5F5_9ACTN
MPAAARVRPWRDPVVAGLGVWALATALWFLAGGAGPRTQVLVTWVSMPPLDLALFVLSRRAGRAAAGAPERRFWRAMAVAAAIFLAGDLSQVAATLARGMPGTIAPIAVQSAASVLGTLVVVAVALTYPIGVVSGAARLRFALDSATVLTAAGVLSWCLLSRPALTVAGSAGFATAMFGFAVLMVGVFVGMRLGRSGQNPLRGPAAATMIGAAVVQSLTSMVIPSGVRDDLVAVRGLLVLLPCFLVAAAARLHERNPGAPRPSNRRRRFSILPYAATTAVFGVLADALQEGDSRRRWVAVTGLFVSFVLVAARQSLALRDNGRLLDRLDEQRNRLESLLRHSSDITSICDAAGRIRYVTPVVLEVLGHRPEDIDGIRLTELVHPDDQVKLESRLGVLFGGPGAQIRYQARFRHADGSYRWIEVVAVNLLEEPGVHGIVSNARDMTEARAARDLLEHQATHDALTGLANRRLLTERMRELAGGQAAMLLIDLDGFKPINDRYGHAAGDEVLLHVAETLRGCSAAGLPARLGGDEFAVLLPGADLTTAERVAARFRDGLSAPALIAGRPVAVRASVGCAAGPVDDGLLHRADLQMYKLKRAG